LRREPTKSRRYIAFDIHDSLLQYCRPHVYRLRIEAITDKVIRLHWNYTLTTTGEQALRYITHGQKQVINKPAKPWNTFGVIALIGLGILALSKV
jgi:hypothetical protein